MMDHNKSSTMVRNTNSESGISYDKLKPGMSASMKLRSPDSPGSFSKSRSKSPGVGRISNRKWSPGQATLIRRKKIEGETSVDDSFDDLNLSDLLNKADDEEVDYLKMSLAAIDKSNEERPKRSGRRPTSSKSIDGSAPNPRVRRTPRKSYSTGNTRVNVDALRQRNKSSSPSRSRNRRKMKSKSMEKTRPRQMQKDLPLEIQKKLYRVTDPELPIKERVELELEFMKGTPEEKRIYLEYRHQFDRQEFFDARALDEQEKQVNIETKAREESIKEAKFQATVERKRQKERQKEEEARERERQAKCQAKIYATETIANTMTDIKKAALQAATVSVARNQFEKQSYEEERRKLVNDFRKNEGKDMHDVQRALKEAVIEQEDPEEKRLRLRGNRPYRNLE